MDQKVDGTRLSGVPETTLWTPHNRASEAARPDGLGVGGPPRDHRPARQLLPTEPQVRNIACSALDRSWMDAVDREAEVLVSAQGLLMYFHPADVFALITDCARRFPGGRMIFDTILPWLSRRTLRGWRRSPTYTAPPMPFGITVPQLAQFPRRLPAIATLTDLRPPRGRCLWGWPAPLLGAHRCHSEPNGSSERPSECHSEPNRGRGDVHLR